MAARDRVFSVAGYLVLLPALACTAAHSSVQSSAPVQALQATQAVGAAVPIRYFRLDNGLRVVMARDTTVPMVRVGLYYDVGPRDEPRGRGGFAHLFEHFMFEGSEHVAPGEFFQLVASNGGRFGARTLYDFTKYTSMAPDGALALLLWAEADRMRGLRFSQERLDAVRATVKSEVRQQAFNRPYGRFVWIDLPELAQTRWENAHSIYGETPDGRLDALDSATIDDARAFFRTFYTPQNAVLAIDGAIDFDEASALVRRYFGSIPRGVRRPVVDLTEPRQTEERRVTRTDPNAPRPAIAVGYHMPPRGTPGFWAMHVIGQVLIEGRDSWMHETLVRRGLTDAVYGGVSAQHGSVFTTSGPNFWTVFAFHDAAQPADTLLAAMDLAVERLRSDTVDALTLQRALAKAVASYYGEWSIGFGEGRLDMLGQFALLDDDPHRVNRFADELRRITPGLVHATAREYLRPSNRTVLYLRAGSAR